MLAFKEDIKFCCKVPISVVKLSKVENDEKD
jgi:hypothetical protein